MIPLNWLYPPKPPEPEIWEWPLATYPGPLMRKAAYIISETYYSDLIAKSGNHKPLRVVFYRYHHDGDSRRMLCSLEFKTLRDAVQYTHMWLEQNPGWRPTLL